MCLLVCTDISLETQTQKKQTQFECLGDGVWSSKVPDLWSAETSSPYYHSEFQIHIPTAETMKSRGLPQPAWVEDPSMSSWLTVRCGFKPPTLWSSRISFFKVMDTKGGYRWIQDTNWSKRAEKRMKETRKMIKVLERFWYIEILNRLLSLKKRLREEMTDL